MPSKPRISFFTFANSKFIDLGETTSGGKYIINDEPLSWYPVEEKKVTPQADAPAPAQVLEAPTFENRRQRIILAYYPRRSGTEKYDSESVLLTHDYFNVRDLLARFFLTAFYEYDKRDNWRNTCIGITSHALSASMGVPNQDYHVPMFDYDGKNVRKRIRADVKALQKNYELGDAWIFGTKRGYHVYFFCDAVSVETYHEMLGKIQCCKGFRALTQKRGFGTLRVSAKYTAFDIKFLYVLRAKKKHLKRMTGFGHTVLTILGLGTQCGTHLAALFPKQARFEEDPTEWRPVEKKKNRVGLNVAPPKKRYQARLLNKKPIRKKAIGPYVGRFTAENTYFTTGYERYLGGENPCTTTTSVKPPPSEEPKRKLEKKGISKYNAYQYQEGCDCRTCRSARARAELYRKMEPHEIEEMINARKKNYHAEQRKRREEVERKKGLIKEMAISSARNKEEALIRKEEELLESYSTYTQTWNPYLKPK